MRALVDDLTEHARVVTAVPFPLSEWQPGDEPDDERWRALTDVERREVLAMVSAYEGLIAWSEGMTASAQPATDRDSASNFLSAERARVGRFRQELRFLERRRRNVEDVESASRSGDVLMMPGHQDGKQDGKQERRAPANTPAPLPRFSPNRDVRGGDRAPQS